MNRQQGFSLVEVIATLGLTLFIMGALFQALLNQTRTNEVASERMSEAQIARSILYRLADELRRVQPPTVPGVEPARARRLLAFGQRDWLNEQAETSQETATSEEGEEIPEIEGAERFALLGTSDRILFLTHAGLEPTSPIDRYLAEKGESITNQAAGNREERRIEADRWSDLRQVYYLARPLPEALDEENQPAAPREPEVDGETETTPIFAGVIRQEVKLVFSKDAQRESFAQLRDHLFAKKDEPELPELELPEMESVSTEENEAPLPDRIQTQVLTERVTAIRFRYHDGQAWQSVWGDPNRLPIAVEIHVSFDPRGADPEFLREYLEEHPLGGDAGAMSSSMDAASTEDHLFAYRLVVALPMAEPKIPAPTEGPTPELPAVVP